MARLNLTMPNQTVKNSLKAKKTKLPQMNFFLKKTTNKIFMYLLAPFILQTFKKILMADPELWGCAIFGPKWPTCHEKIFFGTNHDYYFHLPNGPFHCAKFLKNLTADPDLTLGPKWSICPKQIFFGKLVISFSSTY